jgi:hypothetical protein
VVLSHACPSPDPRGHRRGGPAVRRSRGEPEHHVGPEWSRRKRAKSTRYARAERGKRAKRENASGSKSTVLWVTSPPCHGSGPRAEPFAARSRALLREWGVFPTQYGPCRGCIPDATRGRVGAGPHPQPGDWAFVAALGLPGRVGLGRDSDLRPRGKSSHVSQCHRPGRPRSRLHCAW